jgi:hypothetical protein
MKLTKRRVSIAVVVGTMIALSPYILLFGKYSYHSVFERLRRIPFDSTSWQDAKQVNGVDPVRIRMVDDLVRSRRLDRRSRVEVEKLLGKPTNTNYFKEYDLVYWLGPERSFMGIDSEWLAITLDSSGVVQKYQIVSD